MLNDNEREKYGSYYTPIEIAEYLWSWIKSGHPRTVLEPSAGDGNLLVPAEKDGSYSRFTAVEIKHDPASRITSRLPNLNIDVENKDFYSWLKNDNGRFDAVIANPPFIRYQKLSPFQRSIQVEIMKSAGIRSSRLMNAWAMFMVEAVNRLNTSGRLAIVIPCGFMHDTYARSLRKFVVSNLDRLYIVTFDRAEWHFPGVQQKVVLVLGEKASYANSQIEFKHVKAGHRIPSWRCVPVTSAPNPNWRNWNWLFLNDRVRKVFNSVPSVLFAKLATINVGLTTGDDSFFLLDAKTVRKHRLQHFVRLFVKPRYLKPTLDATPARIKSGSKALMLDLNGFDFCNLPRSVRAYLDAGAEAGAKHHYKVRCRKHWYQIPNVWTPDLFGSRFVGSIPYLIKNDIPNSTSSFNLIKIKDKTINPNLVIIAFYTSFTQLSVEISGRSMGSGVSQLIPGDFRTVEFPNINYTKTGFEKQFCKLNQIVSAGEYYRAMTFSDRIVSSLLHTNIEHSIMVKAIKQLHRQRLAGNRKTARDL